MRPLRAVIAILFALVIVLLFSLPITGAFGVTWAGTAGGLILLAIFFGSQAVYIFGAGTMDLCRPIRKRRLWLPVTVGGAMLALLTTGLFLAAVELIFGQRNEEWFEWVFWGLILGCWIAWGILLWVYTHRIDRFRALHWMTTWIFAGSMAELLATLPAHLWTQSRRGGGCFAFHGMWTGIALMAGIVGLVWAFGPAVILLTFSNRYEEERNAERMRRRQALDSPNDEAPP